MERRQRNQYSQKPVLQPRLAIARLRPAPALAVSRKTSPARPFTTTLTPRFLWRTLPAQVSLCPSRAHLFPFPGENQQSAGPSGTERSSRGSPPSPASQNSAKGGRAPRSGPAGAGQPWLAGYTVLSGEDQRAGRCFESTRGLPGAHSAFRRPREGGPHAGPSLSPDSWYLGRMWQQIIPGAWHPILGFNFTCFARAMGTVLPSSFKQRLIRSLLLFSITLWETGVLCEQKFVCLGWLCPES